MNAENQFEDHQTENGVIADLVMKSQGEVVRSDVPGLEHVVALKGAVKIENIEKLLPAPTRKRGFQAFGDLESFCTYVNWHKIPHRTMLIDNKVGKITATFDGHFQTRDVKDAGWGEFGAVFAPVHSTEFTAWNNAADKPLTQTQFAEFLEDMRHTIIEPTAADIMEIVQNLEVNKNVAFKSKIDRVSGAVNLHYVEEVTPGNTREGSMKLPSILGICLPLFENQVPVTLAVRLAFRVTGNDLKFTVKLDQIDKVLREEREKMAALVSEKVGLPVLF